MGKSRNNQKSYLTIGVITLVAVIVLAGISYRQSAADEADEQEAVIMAESEWTENEESSGNADGAEENGGAGDTADGAEVDEGAGDTADGAEGDSAAGDTTDIAGGVGSETGGELNAADSVQATTVIEGTTGDAQATMAAASGLSFSGSDVLRWPLQGDILINYSMDESVYFATLDQYKYNPALIIRGDVNAQVTAAADGQVVGIESTAETGETVTMDIGNEYQLVYGQLKDLQVAEDDFVEAGELIGYISEPTKYYGVEGSNLYFAMTKDGDPVNPLDYLE